MHGPPPYLAAPVALEVPLIADSADARGFAASGLVVSVGDMRFLGKTIPEIDSTMDGTVTVMLNLNSHSCLDPSSLGSDAKATPFISNLLAQLSSRTAEATGFNCRTPDFVLPLASNPFPARY